MVHRIGLRLLAALSCAALAGACGPADPAGGDTQGEGEGACAAAPCENGGTCTEDGETYTCDCPVGYSGEDCETNVDECASDPCDNGGTCIDGVNGYTCDCVDGFEGPTCQTDIDDCALDPCQNGGVCSDRINTYTCACPDGYDGADCEINIDECASAPCQNGGVCTDGIAEYTCECSDGYTTSDCSISTVAIDAGIYVASVNKTYFFRDGKYIRYDVATDRADVGYPQAISAGWRGLTFGNIDAVFTRGTNAYFFSGTQYIVFNLQTDMATSLAAPISVGFSVIPFTHIDAAFSDVGRDKYYLFSGTEYIQFTLSTGGMDSGFPKTISGNWTGMPFSQIDDVVTLGGDKAYFFSGNQYARYNLATGTTDAGYPLDILGSWSGLEWY